MTAYNIHVIGRRLWVEGPIPVSHLDALTKLAVAVTGVRVAKVVALSDVGKKLGASLAMCSRDDVAAWRAELGLPHSPPEGS